MITTEGLNEIRDLIAADIDKGQFGNAYKSPILTDFKSGLVSYWRLDETTGTSIADSVGTNTGTSANNASTMTTGGKVGNALDFNGSSDYINIDGVETWDNYNESTISMWIKSNDKTQTNKYMYMEGSSTNNNSFFGIAIVNNHLYSFARNAAAETIFTEEASTELNETWHHVVVVRTQTNYILYLDGVLEDSDTFTWETIDSDKTTLGCTGRLSGYANLFNGAIDEVCIFNRALSANEVASLYAGYVIESPQTDDTGLKSAVSTSQQSSTDTTTSRQISAVVIVTSVDGNTNDFSEFALQRSSATAVDYTRDVFTAVTKDIDTDIRATKTLFIDGLQQA